VFCAEEGRGEEEEEKEAELVLCTLIDDTKIIFFDCSDRHLHPERKKEKRNEKLHNRTTAEGREQSYNFVSREPHTHHLQTHIRASFHTKQKEQH
jgi:hypothetical protein